MASDALYVLIYKIHRNFYRRRRNIQGNLNVLIIVSAFADSFHDFFRLKKYWRLGAGVALIIAFQCLHFIDKAMHYTVSTEFGGLIGSVGWAGFFLICTYFGETYFPARERSFI